MTAHAILHGYALLGLWMIRRYASRAGCGPTITGLAAAVRPGLER